MSSKLFLLPPRSPSPSKRLLISNPVARSSTPAAPVTNDLRLGPPSVATPAASPDAQPPAGTTEAISAVFWPPPPSILKLARPSARASDPVGVETSDRATEDGLLRVVGGPEVGAEDVAEVGAEGTGELPEGGTAGK